MSYYDHLREEVARRILELRTADGLTQGEVASRADISERRYGELEKGKANPTLKTLVAVCEALGTDLSDLFDSRYDAKVYRD